MKKPARWSEVYPQGTPEGDEEQKFFIALVRTQDFNFQSTTMLVKKTGLSRERVEEIIEKICENGFGLPK